MRRAIRLHIAVALVASLLLPVTGTPATAGSTFRFFGSGYGHGLGMSQWGAYGLAKMGWSHTRILEHFYKGARVRMGAIPSQIRIELTYGRTAVHLTAQGGPVRIWEGRAHANLVGTIPMGKTWTVFAKAGHYVVRDGSGARVGTAWGGRQRHLVVTYAQTGSRVFVREAGFAYGRGSLELNLYACDGGCVERVIARLDLDEYLYGLGEVPSSWPAASLRAQAVAGRSYAVNAIQRVGIRPSCNCHMSDGVSDQVYVGYSKESGADGDRWVAAVRSTSGQVVRYDGKVIQSFYAASDGGHSENVEDVWHGGNPAYAIPWLTGVCNPGESTSANPWTDWTRTFDAATLTSRLAPYTGAIGRIRRFGPANRGASGRIITIVAEGSSGKATVTGVELRAALGLPDDRVWINADRNIVGPIRETYDRLMCGPGLATSPTRTVAGGAQQYFQDGGLYRNADLELTVWLRAALDREYRTVGAAAGRLGVPVTTVRTLSELRAAACTKCRRIDFVGGRIYWKAGTGAHAIWDPVLAAYLDHGGASGALGLPITRPIRRADGGWRASFEGGRIVCPKDDACVVRLAS
jgi:SpoIID/LytB domain protein